MMAVKWLIPNIPRFEIVNVPPWTCASVYASEVAREPTYLVLLGLQLAIPRLLRKCFAQRRYRCQTLGSRICNDWGNKAVGGSYSNRNVGLRVSE